MTSFLKAIKAIYLRRIKLTFRNKPLIFVRIFQPLFWLLVLGTTFNNMFSKAKVFPLSIDYLSFMTIGILIMTIVFSSLFAGMSLVWDREFGILKEFLVAPIPRSVIPIGNALAAATEGIIQSLIIIPLAILIGSKLNLNFLSLMVYLFVAFLLSMILYGIAASIASKLTNTQGFMAIMNLLTMPLFFISGAIYPVQFLPIGLQEFAILSPVTHAVALIRYFMFGYSSSGLDVLWSKIGFTPEWLEIHLSLIYLIIFAFITITISSLLFRKVTI